ncbi:MAG: YraN family protein [Bacteroidota bacterium]
MKPLKNKKNKEIGQEGEAIARQFLLKKGYQIIKENWQFKHKEIDLIALKDQCLTIIEVKTRQGFYDNPNTAVPKQKQKDLISAANAFSKFFDDFEEIRFDIVYITFVNPQKYFIDHIEDAFYPTY